MNTTGNQHCSTLDDISDQQNVTQNKISESWRAEDKWESDYGGIQGRGRHDVDIEMYHTSNSKSQKSFKQQEKVN